MANSPSKNGGCLWTGYRLGLSNPKVWSLTNGTSTLVLPHNPKRITAAFYSSGRGNFWVNNRAILFSGDGIYVGNRNDYLSGVDNITLYGSGQLLITQQYHGDWATQPWFVMSDRDCNAIIVEVFASEYATGLE